MKETKKLFQLLSPDGVTIENIEGYPTMQKLMKAFNKWKDRYKAQGYYSSNNGRIDLKDLFDRCEVIEVKP